MGIRLCVWWVHLEPCSMILSHDHLVFPAYCIRSIPLRFLPHIPNIMEKEIWGELFRSSSIQGAVMCDVLRLNLVRNQGDPEGKQTRFKC